MEQLRENAPKEEPKTEAKEEPKEEKKEASGELSEIQKGLRERFKDRMAGRKPKEEAKKEEAKEVKSEDKPKDKKAEEKKEPAKEEEKPAKIKVSPKKTHEEDLARAAADSASAAKTAVEMVSKREKADEAKEAKEGDKLSQLPEEIRDQVPIFKAMEKKFPDKYKGISDKYVQTAQRTMEYKNKWEKDNPGTAFDATAEEHNDFFSKNAVKWDERDYHRSIAAMESESIIAEERKRSDEKIRELEAKSTVTEIEPLVRGRQAHVARGVLKEIDPAYEGIVTEDARIDQAKFDALKSTNPMVAKAIASDLSPLAQFVRETEKLFHSSGYFKFEAENPVHQDIYHFIISQEKAIKGLPASEQLDGDGRRFATKPEYDQLPEDQRDNYWTLNKESIVALKGRQVAISLKEKLKELDDDFEKIAKSKGFSKSSAPKPAETKETSSSKEDNDTSDKLETPSSGGEIKTDTLSGGGTKMTGDFRSSLKARMRGATV